MPFLTEPNGQVERPCGAAIFEALYQSRPLQPWLGGNVLLRVAGSRDGRASIPPATQKEAYGHDEEERQTKSRRQKAFESRFAIVRGEIKVWGRGNAAVGLYAKSDQ